MTDNDFVMECTNTPHGTSARAGAAPWHRKSISHRFNNSHSSGRPDTTPPPGPQARLQILTSMLLLEGLSKGRRRGSRGSGESRERRRRVRWPTPEDTMGPCSI